MAGAATNRRVARGAHHYSGRAQGRKMCTQVAWALLVHTLMLIFIVSKALETNGISILPYLLIIPMLAVFVWFARHYDRKWKALAGADISERSLSLRFRMDVLAIWAIAIGLPMLWLLLTKLF